MNLSPSDQRTCTQLESEDRGKPDRVIVTGIFPKFELRADVFDPSDMESNGRKNSG